MNTVGVMGKGIALGFKSRFPDMFDDYVRRCARGEVQLGLPYLYRRSAPPWIVNFPTEGHSRWPSRLDDFATGLNHLDNQSRTWGIESIAVPTLGYGADGLDWSDGGPLLHDPLGRIDIPGELYAQSDSARSHLAELTSDTGTGQR